MNILFGIGQTQYKLDKLLRGQKTLFSNQKDISKRQAIFEQLLKKIETLLVGKPGPVLITITGERRTIGMADKIQFMVSLPTKSALDVVQREVSVSISGSAPNVLVVDGDILVVNDLEGDQDATVDVSLVDIDDSGNRSQPSTASAVLTDTIVPPQPGVLGITVTGETHPEP